MISKEQEAITRIFVSYSRRDAEFVRSLAEALQEAGYFVDFDLGGDDLKIEGGIAPTDTWRERLKSMIAAADVIVFVVSPDSAASAICDWEIGQAQSLGKRLIPILWRPINFSGAPERLAALNVAIAFNGRFSDGFKKLSDAIEVDIEWLREHSRLTVLAQRWDTSGRPASQLIRAGEVSAAEAWAARRPKSAPLPSALVLELLEASRAFDEAERRRLRTTTARAYVEPTNRAVAEGRHEEAIRLAAVGALAANDLEFELVPELWDALAPAIVQSRLLSSLASQPVEGFGDAHFSALEFSADAVSVFAALDARPATIWNVETGQVVRQFGPLGRVGLGVISPNAELVATGSYDDALTLWSAATGAELWRANVNDRPMAFDPTGEFIWTTTGSFRVDTGQAVVKLAAADHVPTEFALSPDGKIVATGESRPKKSGSEILIWNSSSGALLHRLKWDDHPDEELRGLHHQNKIVQLVFSPQSDRLLVLRESEDWMQSRAEEHGKHKYAVELWDVQTGVAELIFIGLKDHANSACFDPAGSLVAAISNGSGAVVWEAATGQQRTTFLQSTNDSYPRGRQIAFHPAGQVIAGPCPDGRVVMWHASSGETLRDDQHLRSKREPLASLYRQVRAVAFSQDGKRFATGASDGSVYVWDGCFGLETHRLLGHAGCVKTVCFSPDGRFLATTGDDRTVRVYELATGNCTADLRLDERFDSFCWFSPDGAKLFALSDDGESTRPWNTEGNISLQSWHTGSWSPSDTVEGKGWLRPYHELLSTFTEGEAREAARKLLVQAGMTEIGFRSDDPNDRFDMPIRFRRANRIFEIHHFRETGTKILDAESGAQIGRLSQFPYHLSVSPCDPQAERIIVADDGAAKIVSVVDGRVLHRLEFPRCRIGDAVFSPDGRHVALALSDGSARIFDVSRTSVLLNNRAAVLAAATSAGLGRLSERERGELLLQDSLEDVGPAIQNQLTTQQLAQMKAIRQALIVPVSSRCYAIPATRKTEFEEAWSPAVESARRRAVVSSADSFFRFAKTEHPRGRSVYEAVAHDVTRAALRHFAMQNQGRMDEIRVVEHTTRFGLNESSIAMVLENALETVSDLHSSDSNAIGMSGADEPDRLSLWERDTQPVWTIQNKKFPKAHRWELEPVATAYLKLPYRSSLFELVLVRSLIACEMYAFGDEMYNEDAKFKRSMGLEVRSPLKRNPWPFVILATVPPLLILVAAGVLVSWIMQVGWLGSWGNWVGFAVGLLAGVIAAGTPGLVLSEARSLAQGRRRTIELMNSMIAAYNEVPESGPLRAELVREKVDAGAKLGVVWSGPLFALLDDIEKRQRA